MSTTLPRLTSVGKVIDTSPERFGMMRSSIDLLGDFPALRERMDSDGYLYLPGFFKRSDVAEVRQILLEKLDAEGMIDRGEPLDRAIASVGVNTGFRGDLGNKTPELTNLIYGPQMMAFYEGLLGAPALHYDYTWMRVVSPGNGTWPHCDVVYMGRGTPNVFTAWVPYGDVPISVGGLIMLEGSHLNEGLRNGYCKLDVDTACTNPAVGNQLSNGGFVEGGAYSLDPMGIQESLGCRWLTADFQMGDLVTFSVFTMHGSLDNGSKSIRLSSDSRYQLSSEPADERWMGENPAGHGGSMVKDLIC